jgi:hypothetical protein
VPKTKRALLPSGESSRESCSPTGLEEGESGASPSEAPPVRVPSFAPESRVGYELGFLLRTARPLWGVVLLSYLVVAQPPKLACFVQREMPDSRQPFGAWFVRRLR